MPRSKRVKANDLLPTPLKVLDREILERMRVAYNLSISEKIEVSMWAIRRTYESLKGMNENLLDDRRIYVMFSGGKDSLVVLDLTYNSIGPENMVMVYIEVTGNTHEENVEYTYRVAKAYGLKEGRNFLHLKVDRDFYELVRRWGWPGPRRRWCMTIFKKNVVNKYLGRVVAATGVKWSDSRSRRRWIKAGVLGIIPGWKTIYLKPIFHWTTNDVLFYIKNVIEPKRGVGVNPLYDKLGSSGNCVYCPFNQDFEYYRRLALHYPQWWEKLLQVESEVRKGKPFLSPKGGRLGFKEIIAMNG